MRDSSGMLADLARVEGARRRCLAQALARSVGVAVIDSDR